jgi:signal transduction histidine kinase
MAKKILYVEDNPQNQELVRRVLESEGYEVLMAEDGLEGIKMAEEIEPDLILMDINLPDMDGNSATTHIKNNPKLESIPIIALTANVLEEDKLITLVAGCDVYLQKPIDIDLLLKHVRTQLINKEPESSRLLGISESDKLKYLKQFANNLVNQQKAQIEELQQKNEELRELDRLKSQFLSTVSHELRTPLNVIKGYGEALQEQWFGPLNERQGNYVSRIVSSTGHLYDLVADLLDLTRIESGKLSIQKRRFELAPALEELRIMLEPLAEKKQLYFSIQVENSVDTMVADRLRFKQIIQNLLSNAIKFTPQGGGVVCIISQPSQKVIKIEVIDTGIGIAAENHEVIFERFRQVEPSPNRAEGEGMGLGLALTREFIELHDGSISLVDSALGRGSTFMVILPQPELTDEE